MTADLLDFKQMTPLLELLSITIPFAPQRKRATQAFRSRYGKQIVSDPDRALKLEIADWIFKNAILPAEVFKGPVVASFLFTFAPPKSYSKKKAAGVIDGVFAHGVHIDHDNMVKLYQDALQTGPLENKIWVDDCQVAIAHTAKIWAREASVTLLVHGASQFSPALLLPFF